MWGSDACVGQRSRVGIPNLPHTDAPWLIMGVTSG